MDHASLFRCWRSSLRFRVSLRGFMALVLVLAVILGWYLRGVRVQRDAVDAVKSAGGSVSYDWAWGNENPDILSPNGKLRMPTWLASRVGVDYVANVVWVSLVPRRETPRNQTDAALAQVGRLGRVESLSLNNSDVTDAGIAHLKDLTRLRQVDLMHTRVGDASVGHLQRLPGLRLVFLAGTRVTDNGVLALEKALPQVQILLDEDVVDERIRSRADADLEFARTRPVRQAARLLIHRARLMAARGDIAGLAATLDAFCDLEADTILGLVRLAWACNEALGILEPSVSPRLPAAQRQALRRRCADHGIAALTRAVEKGYDNNRLLKGDPDSHPATLGLIDTLRVQGSGR